MIELLIKFSLTISCLGYEYLQVYKTYELYSLFCALLINFHNFLRIYGWRKGEDIFIPK